MESDENTLLVTFITIILMKPCPLKSHAFQTIATVIKKFISNLKAVHLNFHKLPVWIAQKLKFIFSVFHY